MASSMIVIKTAAYGGGQTSAMNQMTAQTYLGNLLQKGSSRVTNLSQALNQAFNDQGKSCGNPCTMDMRRCTHLPARRASPA